jgi:aspartyl-tRNA(Asn)/glutamyl-tRNA(Gln) amidotransferase subunit A
MTIDVASASARAQALALAARKISSVELTQEILRRLEDAHERTNAVVSFEHDEALDAARKADASLASGRPAGPLVGVPLAHKDMFDRIGKIASWGARIRADKPARQNATVIERLRAAGSHECAALHLAEFAFGGTGHNYVLGHARNPWDPTRITGGSSSGTACAVAAGAIPVGLGSDTAGSLRLPAAACGVASIKPTWGRVSRAGSMPFGACLDSNGFIARHVEDLALLLGLVAGRDERDLSTSNLPVPDYLEALGKSAAGLRLGIDERLVRDTSPEIQAMLDRVVAVLTGLGMKRAVTSFGDWSTIEHLTQLAHLPDVTSAHFSTLASHPQDYSPQVKARLEIAYFISGVDHMTALRARGTVLQNVLTSTYKDVDVVILPIYSEPLPTLAELDIPDGPSVPTLVRLAHLTRPVNYLGLPALTLPAPRHGGLPNGVQVIARPYAESLLFTIGAAYQRVVPPEIAHPLS